MSKQQINENTTLTTGTTLAGTTYTIEITDDHFSEKNRRRAMKRKNDFHFAAAQERLSQAIDGIQYPNTHQYAKAKIFTSSTSKKKGWYPSIKTERQRAAGKREIAAYINGEYDYDALACEG